MRDTWTALQFDDAVIEFGEFVDRKCAELDENRMPLHTVKEYVYNTPMDGDLDMIVDMDIEMYRGIPGIGARYIDNTPEDERE